MKYFVYDLIDPRTNKTFYVGKGQGDRPYQHERDALKGRQSRKCDLIRDILDSGNKVKVSIVQRFEFEEDAYEYEIERIAEFGLYNLTNVMPGGGGKSKQAGFIKSMSPKQAEIMARALRFVNSGKRLMIFKYDITHTVEIALRSFVNAAGFDHVKERLAVHNVNLEMAHG